MNSHYLLDLLRQHSRVIIPNFGAFLLKTKPQAGSDSELQINFNDFLKFNDGLLIDYVSQTEKIDKYEAEHQVKEYVSQIQYSLINQGTFEVEGLGTIYKDEKDGLKFRKSGSSQIISDNKEKPISEKPKSMTGLSPLLSDQDEKQAEPIVEKKDKATFEIPKKQNTDTPEEKPQVKVALKPVSKASPKPATTAPKPTTTPRKRKKLLPIWRHVLIIVVVLIIVAFILFLAGFFDSPDNQEINNSNQVAQTSMADKARTTESQENKAEEESEQQDKNVQPETNNESDAIIEPVSNQKQDDNLGNQQSGALKKETEKKAEPVKTVPASKTSTTRPTNSSSGYSNELKHYHIIAGSFNDKGNAYNFVLKLRAKGFESRIINKNKGFYRVSYGSYSTKYEALSALPDIREKENSSAWYLYHKMSE